MLTVYTEEANQQQANAVYFSALQSATKVRSVGMYGFCACTDPDLNLVMGTTGAGPCQIIVVHGSNKTGALGHYGGTPHTKLILAGVEKMVAKLGLASSEVAALLFAAGVGVGENKRQQKIYELAIYGGTLKRYPSATVSWPS